MPTATFAPTPAPAITVIQFGTPDSDFASDVAIDRAGNVYVVGTIDQGALPGQTSLGEVDAYVRKYDSHGNEIWTRQFGTQSQDHASGVRVDGAGNVVVVGFTRGAFPGETNLGNSDAYVRKYDGDGNELWTRQFGGEGMDMANGMAMDRTGNVYVVGFTLGSDRGRANMGEDDVHLHKYDSDGNELWTRQSGTEISTRRVAIDGADEWCGDRWGGQCVRSRTTGRQSRPARRERYLLPT